MWRAAEPLIRRGLQSLPAEMAHDLAIRLLPMAPRLDVTRPASLATSLCGIPLVHPVGLAAGFDKNARAFAGLLRLGFSFVETGTVTRLPQAGNAKPRLFRLEEDRAIVNRMGFNNDGLDVFLERLAARRGSGTVGANIGLNKTSSDALGDYAFCLERVLPLADYVTINVSSPNTPGLRALQAADALRPLLARLAEARGASSTPKPLLLKIAPDLSCAELDLITDIAIEHGIDGMIVSNTTIMRPDDLGSAARAEQGGLSGRPLFVRSTDVLRHVARRAAGRIDLVGVGGIMSGADAYAKIRAGARAVQLYTSFVYDGPRIVSTVLDGLIAGLEEDGFATLEDAIGADLRLDREIPPN